MTATAHVVRVQNVQAENFAFFFGNGAVGLCRKELLACFGRERLLLRKGDAFFDDFVLDADHCRKVHFVVLPNNHSGKDRKTFAFTEKDSFYESRALILQKMGVPAHICAVGLYCKASRAHLRHARAALATKPRYASLVPKGALIETLGSLLP